MNIDVNNWFVHKVLSIIQRYDNIKYWKMRDEVVNPNSKKSKFIRLYYLYKIKKSDAFNNASMGTDLGKGATFLSKPILPHHTNGIIIHHEAIIGKNCVLHQQVTLSGRVVVGDNVSIGTGAKIIGNIKIGDNVKIGANAVVVKDIPSNCTAVGVPAKVIFKK